ncbi:MAG TPA: fumarylacetoacetate hydrolase family protein [Candidatus Nanopelagicaceae bacterium]|jgi:2-keto-4-pentenoate hydratase/2-oxohepta-3-ene-1,7-dioic acid hydratase in catechol pathway|nr:fumarylacetoacetate hydrolase family protein [Candidatus Nanopelagicaceae bacterium]
MRIVRFTPPQGSKLGSDPHFGVMEDEKTIRAIASDPLYAGIFKEDETFLLEDVRLLAPVIPRSKVVCVGKNYADHAAEMGGEVPEEPIIFIKPNTSVIGPNDIIQWPSSSERIDHEAELAVVISKICKEVPREKAKDVIFGYTVANDVTARDLQKKDGQWSRAKGFDTFCPIGPWIDTEFVPGSQLVTATVDGELKQSAPLSDMVFDVPFIIEFVTKVMTLLPGDVILTGTPSGIGPMNAGGEVEVAVEGLGSLKNKVSNRAS